MRRLIHTPHFKCPQRTLDGDNGLTSLLGKEWHVWNQRTARIVKAAPLAKVLSWPALPSSLLQVRVSGLTDAWGLNDQGY